MNMNLPPGHMRSEDEVALFMLFVTTNEFPELSSDKSMNERDCFIIGSIKECDESKKWGYGEDLASCAVAVVKSCLLIMYVVSIMCSRCVLSKKKRRASVYY